MTAAFKHRLLGTTILVLAAIIFLPDLLDGEKQVVKDDFKVIPNRPEFQGLHKVEPFNNPALQQQRELVQTPAVSNEVAVEDESASVNEDDNGLPSQSYASVTAGTPAATPPLATATPASTPVQPATANSSTAIAAGQAAWVVRVGSFSNPQNANALLKKLRDAGHPAFTRNITNSAGQQLTSVLVGPDLRKAELERKLPALQQLTGIERLNVISYQPIENN
ncbi:SPOR domain-containing protein [Arsukibacterium sp.]|uniref:SPOR domain-containing protein n=1 Tax=Arsukibacterium sp. TaxID=1977258 RepID=UPI002FD95822